MTASRLYQQAFAFSDNTGTAFFEFNPVQQGSVWTGTIAAVVPYVPVNQVLLPVQQQDTFGQAQWTLYRNGVPEMTWLGYTLLTDFQGHGLESITIAGIGLVPNSRYQMLWTGLNQPDYEADILYPKFSATSTEITDVPASQVQIGQTGIVGLASTANLLIGFPGSLYQLWHLELGMTACGDKTVSTTAAIHMTAVTNPGGTVLAAADLVGNNSTTLAVSPTAKSTSLDLRGYTLDDSVGLDISVSAAGGSGIVFNGRANITYSLL